MKVSNWIEMPRDEYGNRGHTNSQPQIIKARVEPGRGKPGTYGGVATLHVIEPADIREKWSTVREKDMSGGWWVEVDHPYGIITEEEYADIIETISDAPACMIEAARSRADGKLL